MPEETQSARAAQARVSAIVPVDERGRHEMLRLGAALAAYLRPDYAGVLSAAAEEEHVTPAHVESIVECDAQRGVIAEVEGRRVALGHQSYLAHLGLLPKAAELHAGQQIEAEGGTALYLLVLRDVHCLGILGIA